MRYSAIIQEHVRNPRNTGPLDGATHRAEGTNPVCGDHLALHLTVTGGRIRAASFEAEGCPPTHAAGSVLTEKILESDVSWALGIQSNDVISWIGGVPPGKEHAAHLAVEVLRAALKTTDGH